MEAEPERGWLPLWALQSPQDGRPARSQAQGKTLSIILVNFGWRIVEEVQLASRVGACQVETM